MWIHTRARGVQGRAPPENFDKNGVICCILSVPKYVIIPKRANRNNSRLLFSSAEMFKKPLWQKVWTQIRQEQSVLGLCCLLIYLIRQYC